MSLLSFTQTQLTNLVNTINTKWNDTIIHSKTNKVIPVDADEFVLLDSEDTFKSKKTTFAQLKVLFQSGFSLPTQTGNNGKVLKTDGTNASWGTVDTAITKTAGDNSTNIATTAFVKKEIPNELNASGSAPIYACRAWVNFNGTGTVDIRACGNVSSITDNGTGDYTVNFITAMPDANYSVCGAGGALSNAPAYITYDSPTVTSVRVGNIGILYAYSPVDGQYQSIAIFR